MEIVYQRCAGLDVHKRTVVMLDADGKIVTFDDPERFKKAVHLKDIHLEKGMHCVDCHFEQDVHGNGNLTSSRRIAAMADPQGTRAQQLQARQRSD